MSTSTRRSASVYDFIYVDLQRIALFTIQLNNLGSLKAVTEEKHAIRSSNKGDRNSMKGSLAIASGSSEISSEVGAEHGRYKSQSYDPVWMNALSFLELIKENKLLNQNISNASFGDIVSAEGTIGVRDLASLSSLWDKKTVKSMIHSSASDQNGANRQERRKASREQKKASGSTPSEIDLFLDLIGTFPHTVQLLVNGVAQVWCVLKEEGIVGSSNDFVLKFGASIPGEWKAIGILEAKPDLADAPPIPFESGQISEMILTPMASVIRTLLGRPPQAYGFTPLLVFREIKAR